MMTDVREELYAVLEGINECIDQTRVGIQSTMPDVNPYSAMRPDGVVALQPLILAKAQVLLALAKEE